MDSGQEITRRQPRNCPGVVACTCTLLEDAQGLKQGLKWDGGVLEDDFPTSSIQVRNGENMRFIMNHWLNQLLGKDMTCTSLHAKAKVILKASIQEQ